MGIMQSPERCLFADGFGASVVATDATATIVDYVDTLNGAAGPINFVGGVAIGSYNITTASGGAGGAVAVKLDVETDDNSSFTSATNIGTKTETFVATAAGDGLHKGSIVVPFSGQVCERYVRCKMTQTKAGVTTVTPVSMHSAIVFTTSGQLPHPSWAAAGWSEQLVNP